MTRRNPSQYDFNKLKFDERILTKHFSKRPKKNVKFIVAHHMVVRDRNISDDEGLDTVFNIWQSRPASAHYGVEEGFIGQYVWDKDYAWATGSTYGNEYGISIEHINKTLDEPGSDNDYLVSEKTWKTGAKLAAYLHLVYDLGRPVAGKTLKRHSEFSSTACPGPYLGGKIWGAYVKEAQRVYDQISRGEDPTEAPSGSTTVSSNKPFDGVQASDADRDMVASWQWRIELKTDGLWGTETDSLSAHLRNAALHRTAGDKDKALGYNVKTVQRIVDVAEDGVWGPKTQAALEKWVDGVARLFDQPETGKWTDKIDDIYMELRRNNRYNF